MKKEVKIALLVLGAIAIAFFGINFLKGKNIFLPQQNYYAIYPRVDGLSVTNPIWINGFKVGQVSSIDFVPGNQDQLLVALRITNPKVKLTEQTVAKIVSADILGSKGIDLQVKPGNYILPGDTLISDMEDGIMDIVSEQIAPIKAKAENLITSLDSVLIILRTALNESSLNQLGQSFYGIRGTFESVLVSAKNLEELIKKQSKNIGRAVENVAAVTDVVEGNKEEIDASLKNLKVITDDLAAADFKTTLLEAQKAVVSVKDIMETIDRGEGSLGKMVKTDSMHTQLVEAIKDLEFLLEDMRANPSRYVNFSLIGRKDDGLGLSREEEKKLRKMLKE